MPASDTTATDRTQRIPVAETDVYVDRGRFQRDFKPGSRSNDGADETQFLTRVRVNNKTVVLDQHDSALLRQKLAEGQVSVARCQDHKRDRCECWLPTRQFVWNLQPTRPDSAITKASEQLWTAVEEFARAYTKPKEVDPSISALIQAFEDREPDWFGKRSQRAVENQKANAARRKSHDFRCD